MEGKEETRWKELRRQQREEGHSNGTIQIPTDLKHQRGRLQAGKQKMMQKVVQMEQIPVCCLTLPKIPMTIPCGHDCCMNCIKTYWDKKDEKMIYSCPKCRETFTLRGQNTMSADLVKELKKTGPQPADHHCCVGPEDVPYETHLQPHYASPIFKKHKLVDPSTKLQENICSHHNEVMTMFCRTDQHCICFLCSLREHQGHDTVSAAAERMERQRELKLIRQEIQQRLQEREEHAKVLQQQVEDVNHSANKAVEDGERISTEPRGDAKQRIRSQQKTQANRVKELREKLQQEITELRREDGELQQLSHTRNHIQFLLDYLSLSAALSPSTNPLSVNVHPVRHFEDKRAAVSQVRHQRLGIPSGIGTNVSLTANLSQSQSKTRAKFLRYTKEITLDPNTAHRELLLSEGNRQVTLMSEIQPYPSHPHRFTYWCQVLSKERLTGRCYWEVELRGRGIRVAVAYKDISRTGSVAESALGFNEKSWGLDCFPESCNFCHDNIYTRVSGPMTSSRVGVYLDHRAGILSFFDASDTMTLLHRIQTKFTHPLYAGIRIYYCPGAAAVFHTQT